jgi:hypothetical protein
MPTPSHEIEIIAHHESAHHIAAYLLDAKLGDISISERKSGYELEPDYMKRAIVYMAGGEIEELKSYNAFDMIARIGADYQRARECAIAAGFTSEQSIGDFIEQAIEGANEIVLRNIDLINDYAKVLIGRDSMNGTQANETILTLATEEELKAAKQHAKEELERQRQLAEQYRPKPE